MSTSFSPSPAELALVSQIFAQSDPQKLGVITGEVAVRVFGGAKLAPTVLGEIWSIADEDNKGWLPKKGVAIAVRLMGWAQKGEKVTQALVNKPGPLPIIEGISVVAQHNTGMSMPKSPPPGLPPFTPQDKAKFQNMFLKSGPTNGLLSGDRARDIFVKSKLSNENLLQIWNLADTQDRGALDSTDFAIGMYLIQGLMSGQLSFVPSSLPPGLYQQAGGNPSSNQGSIRSHTTGNSGSFSPLSSTFSQNRGHIQTHNTGQQMLQPEHTGFSSQNKPAAPRLPVRPNPAFGTGAFGSPPGSSHMQRWDVTAAEKANADRYFENLDPQRRGFIEGDVAVPFMLESKLPGEDLAQVWDLADINGDGRLTRDGFAVAMYLIQKKLAGTDIPTSLPPSLIPPSMRTNGMSPFSPPQTQKAQEPAKDLFSWDDTPPQSATASQPTGGNSFNTLRTQQTGQHLPGFTPQPAPRPTGDPFGSSSAYAAPVSHADLLGDDDEAGATSLALHDQSAEIGNVQIQLNSTNRSLETAKTERASAEQTLANQAAQLSTLQTQLSSAKAAYEAETKLLSTLRERHSTQTTDIQKAREELIRAESDLSAVRVEKAEVEGAFLRDKEDARDLHRKMVEAGQQVEMLKLEVEKVKKEAKQQKGLLAIAKKQLSSRETDKVKVEKELDEVNREVTEVNREREEAEANLANGTAMAMPDGPERESSSDSLTLAASHTLPVSPDPASPVGGSSVGKSNNPFERLVMSSEHSTPRSQSPFLPFAGAPVPTPTVAGNGVPIETTPADVSKADPFGFSQVFEAEEHAGPLQDPQVVNEGTETSTPKLPLANISVPIPMAAPATEASISPTTASESEHFITPPTTVTTTPIPQNPVASAAAQFPALDGSTSPFPPVETNIPGHFPEPETDLAAQLKELEVDESDSDSEDEDEVPLASLAKGKTDVDKAEPNASAPATNGTATSGSIAPLDLSTTSFDDVFNVTPPTMAASSPSVQPFVADESKDAFGIPAVNTGNGFGPSTAETMTEPAAPVLATTVAGVNAFDEAMGNFPSTLASGTPQFTFESAFDDNFDFASATATDASFPPAPTAMNGHSVSPTRLTANKNDGFDSIFTTPAIAAPSLPLREPQKPTAFVDTISTSPTTQPAISQTATGVSFDEAFSGFESGPALNLDSSFTSPVPVPHPVPMDSPTQKPSPATSPSSLSKSGPSSPRPAATRAGSTPPREKSPPPRISSPKSRPSASSSKETQEKLKELPTRHSKLSIRLPFGKKKKQESLPPPPSRSQHLSSTPEEPTSATSPTANDDVEPVKRLMAMGFSRAQAVSALEKYAYNVPKALDSLLGAQ